MRRTHAGLCSPLPLSLIGPEPAPYSDTGERGTKGVRVPLGRTGGIFSPKSRTFALDTSVRPYYHILRSNRNSVTQGGTKNPGKPRDPTQGIAPEKACPRAVGGRGTQRPGPSQRPSRRPEAQAKSVVSSPRVPCPFPIHPGDGRSTILLRCTLFERACRLCGYRKNRIYATGIDLVGTSEGRNRPCWESRR